MSDFGAGSVKAQRKRDVWQVQDGEEESGKEGENLCLDFRHWGSQLSQPRWLLAKAQKMRIAHRPLSESLRTGAGTTRPHPGKRPGWFMPGDATSDTSALVLPAQQ
eukprot:168311-Rhodomonas_salina.2